MITPTQDYRRIEAPVPPPMHKGLDAMAHGIARTVGRGTPDVRTLLDEAGRIDALAPAWRDLSDAHLRDRLAEFRDWFRRGRPGGDTLLPAALAAVREAAARRTGLCPYPVQLAGALALRRGCLVEMATGEGKTLTAALAATLVGWTGFPCHVVTVNDYLARRDAEWFNPLYQFCGVSAGAVTSDMDPVRRREGYGRDVTYTTSKEVVADFLRDRLRLGAVQQPIRRLLRGLLNPKAGGAGLLVMRGVHTGIIDEADSVLIDEAVTPLIIAQPRENRVLREAAAAAHGIAAVLEPGRHYRIDPVHREVELLDAGRAEVAARADGLPGIWRGLDRRRELIEQALTARELFLRDRNYVIQEGRVVIVDEFTGRLMPNRNWSEGLHQAIQAKESIEITEPDETLARLSFQRYFRLYRRIAGMTGTAREAAPEFWQTYRLPVVVLPTHRPCRRMELPDLHFTTAEARWTAVVGEIAAVHETGRPILVGTRSVGASEDLARRLEQRGLSFRLLNALRHREEAQIVAEAGLRGRITVATNMAGRGTDIKLGHGVADLGGLHVIATERHESRRIDRQLFGRCARQGDAGSARACVSLEDDLIRRFVPAPVRRLLHRRLDVGGETAVLAAAVRYAQSAAQRLACRQRENVLRTDTWLDEALSFTGPSGAR